MPTSLNHLRLGLVSILSWSTALAATMADFDDHNPFQTDLDAARSDSESPDNNNVDLSSEPSTPPAHPARIPASPPVSPGTNRVFSSPPSSAQKQASFRAPQPAFKSEFCCARDRWLHSGEDVEIQVRSLEFLSNYDRVIIDIIVDLIPGG